jgi:hypothetical protein
MVLMDLMQHLRPHPLPEEPLPEELVDGVVMGVMGVMERGQFHHLLVPREELVDLVVLEVPVVV